MEQETILKIGGIAIVAVMAFSMLAASFLYAPDSSNTNTDGINTNSIINSFEYDIGFESTVVKEINSFRMVAKTSNLNKAQIDKEINSINGISKIGSEFRKIDDSTWNYYAEVTLKKSANLNETIDLIYALDYFSESDRIAMKYMTLSSPGPLVLYNPQLDINRNFTFEAAVLPSLVSIETMPGDTVSVNGKITLRGMEVTALELIESANVSSQPQYFSVEKTLPIISFGNELLFEGAAETIDENYYNAQIKLIDENAQIYFVPDENIIRFAGQSTVENSDAIVLLFSEINSLSLYRDAEFELSSIFVAELGKEVALDSNNFTAQVRLGHAIDEEVMLTVNLFVTRDVASIMQAIEN
jgi:hypothetical protein